MSDANDGDPGAENGVDGDETGVVTVFLRHGSAVLLFRRSEAVGSYPGRWGAVAGHAEGDPERLARVEVREETGIDPDRLAFVRRGPPFPVEDPDHGTWRVHPFLFDCPTRAVTTNRETTAHEWVQPTAILDRETVPELWESYRRVAPTVPEVREDREHGAEYVSRCAVAVLRDAAAALAAGVDPPGDPLSDLGDEDGGGDRLAALADALLDARGSMVVVANRVRRTMADAAERERKGSREADCGPPAPAAVRRAAEALLDGLDGATVEPVDALRGATVATCSRSGTVRRVLAACDPAEVVVTESRPGGEGRGVAATLADDLDATVTLCADAGVAHALDARDADAVLVGADTVLADGAVVNKVGTRTLAAVASVRGVPTFVATHSDKVAPPGHEPALEPRDGGDLFGGNTADAGVAVLNPTFDVTPAALVDRYLTERGEFTRAEVLDLAPTGSPT